MTSSPRSRRTFVIAALLAAQGCSFELMEQAPLLENRCQRDSDCSGATCELGMCVAPADEPLAITLEVTPASAEYGLEPPAIVLPSVTLEGAEDQVFRVPEATTVFGDVTVDAEPIAATLRFVPVTSGPAFAARQTTAKTAASEVSVGMQTADYVASLLQDTAYRVTVLPVDSAVLPPHRLLLDASSELSRRMDVAYDRAKLFSQAVVVEGVPAGAWSVVAVDPATGEEISTRVTLSASNSSVVLTSVEPFDSFDLVIAPISEPGSSASLPTFGAAGSERVDPDTRVLTLRLPPLTETVSFTGAIEHCRDLSLEPVVAARPAMAVALRSKSLLALDGTVGMLGSFATTATAEYDPTLQEWSFSAQVPPGQYEIVVTPAAAEACSVFAESRTIQAPSSGASATAALLQLQSLSFLAGRVRAAGQTSMPVAGGTIVANALGLRDAIALAPNDGTVTRYNRSQQASTDSLGEFMLPIDVGAYDVIVKPPTDSGFAWQVLRDVNVGARVDTPFEREINLSAPVVLRGRLETSLGAEAMNGATLHAYTTAPDAERGVRAVLLGSAVADDNGHFMLLLPAAIEQGWF